MRCAIYARVSTFDQEPENQLAELRRYVEARGWTTVEYVDRAIDRQLAQVARTHPITVRLQQIPGVGVLTATAMVGAVTHIHTFRRGREFASWLGLTRQMFGRIVRGEVSGMSWASASGRFADTRGVRVYTSLDAWEISLLTPPNRPGCQGTWVRGLRDATLCRQFFQ